MALSAGQPTLNSHGFCLNPFHSPQHSMGKTTTKGDCDVGAKDTIPINGKSQQSDIKYMDNGKNPLMTVTPSPFSHCSIIQCPNPTSNPLADHQKQKEVKDSQMKLMEDANYMESMEKKMMEQQQLIETLQAQNQLLSMQLRQHQDYITMVQGQNNALLTAYNALQTIPHTVVSGVIAAPSSTSAQSVQSVGQQGTTWNALMNTTKGSMLTMGNVAGAGNIGVEGQSDL